MITACVTIVTLLSQNTDIDTVKIQNISIPTRTPPCWAFIATLTSRSLPLSPITLITTLLIYKRAGYTHTHTYNFISDIYIYIYNFINNTDINFNSSLMRNSFKKWYQTIHKHWNWLSLLSVILWKFIQVLVSINSFLLMSNISWCGCIRTDSNVHLSKSS